MSAWTTLGPGTGYEGTQEAILWLPKNKSWLLQETVKVHSKANLGETERWKLEPIDCCYYNNVIGTGNQKSEKKSVPSISTIPPYGNQRNLKKTYSIQHCPEINLTLYKMLELDMEQQTGSKLRKEHVQSVLSPC